MVSLLDLSFSFSLSLPLCAPLIRSHVKRHGYAMRRCAHPALAFSDRSQCHARNNKILHRRFVRTLCVMQDEVSDTKIVSDSWKFSPRPLPLASSSMDPREMAATFRTDDDVIALGTSDPSSPPVVITHLFVNRPSPPLTSATAFQTHDS